MKIEELREVLAHPEFRAAVLRILREDLIEAGASRMVSYAEAALLTGFKQRTIAHWVNSGMVKGGKGQVSLPSLQAYSKRRHPRRR